MKIVSCVTTVARSECYLQNTLTSLEAGGFTPEIFHDNPPSGAYQAFQRALYTMVQRDADAVIVFQDDIEVSRGLHDWLVRNLYPEDPTKIGCVSLYTAKSQDPGVAGWYQMKPTMRNKVPGIVPFGALAFLFPMESARKLVKAFPQRHLLHETCAHVGKFCCESGLSFWHHSPSFVRHTGIVSAVNSVWDYHDHENNPHRNCGEDWLREVPL